MDITKKLQKTRIKKNIQNTRTHPHEMAGRPNTPAARGHGVAPLPLRECKFDDLAPFLKSTIEVELLFQSSHEEHRQGCNSPLGTKNKACVIFGIIL